MTRDAHRRPDARPDDDRRRSTRSMAERKRLPDKYRDRSHDQVTGSMELRTRSTSRVVRQRFNASSCDGRFFEFGFSAIIRVLYD